MTGAGIGAIIGAAGGATGGFLQNFGKRTAQRVPYNRMVDQNLDALGYSFGYDNNALNTWLNQFGNATGRTKRELLRMGNQAEGDYNALLASERGYDPLATYERLRSGNLGALQDYSGYLEGRGTREDSLAKAAMGLGGRPDGSYERTLRADRISRNTAPVLGNIFSSLGSDTSTIGTERRAGLSDKLGIIDRRTELPLLGYGMELDPANALLAIRSGQTGLLADQAGAAAGNTAGFTEKRNDVARWGDAIMGSLRGAGEGAQIGMGIGSGMGGMLGGGGASASAAGGGPGTSGAGALGSGLLGGGGRNATSQMSASDLMSLIGVLSRMGGGWGKTN